MLCKTADLQLTRVLAIDGEVGKVRDVYFDDVDWVARYLLVDPGDWLSGRQVLIEPRAVHLIDRARRTISVCLTRARIALSASAVNTHLRSAREALGFTVITIDGHVGQLKDFMIDDESWALRFLIVQCGSWLLGRRVLVNAGCVRRVDWVARSLEVNQTREQMERGSAFDSARPPSGHSPVPSWTSPHH